MPAPQVFQVLTHFNFEVGAAVVNASKLESAVQGVSDSANEALFSLKRLGFGLVADFGLGASSLLGVLGQAFKASENFTKAQLANANIISANMDNLVGDIDTYNDRLKVSGQILRDISKDAAKFGLPEQELADFTKLTAALLIPKGLAGTNFDAARGLSRDLLKAAPSLGVSPGDVQGQLIRSIEGGASTGDPLFRRLAAETAAFQEKFKGAKNAAQAFNALPIKERFQLISTGLKQFTSDTEILAAQANQFDRILLRLRDTFVGFNGILKPLGDVIGGPIKQALNQLITILQGPGREIIERFSGLLKPLIGDLNNTVVTLLQLREAGNDFRASGFTILILGFLSIFRIFTLVRIASVGLVAGMKLLLAPIMFIGRAFVFLLPVFKFVAAAALKFSLALLPIFVIFQTISRAIAIAKVNDILALPVAIGKLAEQTERFFAVLGIVFGPALQFFNEIAKAIAPIFQLSLYLGYIVKAFQLLNDVLVVTFAIIRGFIFAIGQFVQNLQAGKIFGAFDGVADQFRTGVDDFFDQFLAKTQTPDGETRTAGNVTNIAKVEIRNDFKEKLEPDRIAFTLKDQLLKVAQNPTQANGRTFANARGGN